MGVSKCCLLDCNFLRPPTTSCFFLFFFFFFCLIGIASHVSGIHLKNLQSDATVRQRRWKRVPSSAAAMDRDEGNRGATPFPLRKNKNVEDESFHHVRRWEWRDASELRLVILFFYFFLPLFSPQTVRTGKSRVHVQPFAGSSQSLVLTRQRRRTRPRSRVSLF